MSKEVQQEMVIRELEKRYSKERETFSEFVKTFFKIYYKKEFIWNWHYDEICNNLQDLFDEKIKLLVLNLSPQSGKTELVTKLFPLWCLGKKEMKIMSTGYSADLTKGFSENVRSYYQSDAFRLIFPRRKELKKESIEEWGDELSYYRATGVDGTICGKGADLYLIDDPLNPSEIQISGRSMDKVNTWFSGTARSRLSPTGMGLMCIVMQRLHDNDLTGYVTRRWPERFKEGRWKQVAIDAEKTKDGEHGSFFPELFPMEYLNDKREEMTTERGSNFYAAQYRQNPIDVDNSEFKRSQFRYFKEEDIGNDTGKIKIIRTYIGVDPAISESQRADNSSICVVSQDTEDNYYRRASFAGRVGSDILIDKIFAFQSAFNCPVIIEALNFQRVLSDSIRKEMIRRNHNFQLVEIKSRGEKEARIRNSLQPLYRNFKIFHLESDEFSNFEDELLRFPKGLHDDEIDGFETAISQFSPRTKQKDWTEELRKLREMKITPVANLFKKAFGRKRKR